MILIQDHIAVMRGNDRPAVFRPLQIQLIHQGADGNSIIIVIFKYGAAGRVIEMPFTCPVLDNVEHRLRGRYASSRERMNLAKEEGEERRQRGWVTSSRLPLLQQQRGRADLLLGADRRVQICPDNNPWMVLEYRLFVSELAFRSRD